MNNKSRILYSFLVISALLFQSCATILSPEKGPFTLDSNPGTAQVFDENDNLIGSTPFDLKKLGKRVKKVTVKKEGYVDKQLNITRKSKNGMLFLDAMLLCIPCIVDMGNDNITTFYPKNKMVDLRKAPKEYDKTIMLAVEKVSFDNDNNIKGKINGSVKRVGDKNANRSIGEVEYADGIVIEKFAKSYIDPVTVAANNNSKSGISKAKVTVKPVINEMDFQLKGKYVRDYEGSESMKCTWNFYRAGDAKNKIGSIVTNYHVAEGQKNNIQVKLNSNINF